MPRIFIKGGVWKNTEDEILKAAVMKYGKNQWARISSLLVRKSPKQCKARWYEWLDPSIKKTEWSKEEEEKLLHLAKIMPCQWRSIAPILKRTPAQCLEHYERLLDKAQGRLDEFNPEDDPRRLRPGEIDPNPETKPARPDPVDMDEDEKEMLAEARARLANTKGKKAKRKAREKQLEEARRLASLQKRREMKAAGIELKNRKRKYGIDYNREIPFEKKVPIGFYDVSQEDNRLEQVRLTNVLKSKLEGKLPSEIEAERRKEDMRKAAEKGDDVAPAAVAEIKRESVFEQARKRSKLSLPAPQVGDKELDEIIKLGYAGEQAKAVVAEADESGAPSRTLLATYNIATTGSSLAMRTPRTPAAPDTVMREAQNLLALSKAETPLKGGENTPLHPTSFDGLMPTKHVPQTPNSVMQLGTPGRAANISATPFRGSTGGGAAVSGTPLRTPLRDELAINPVDDTESLIGSATPGSVRSTTQASLRQQLRNQLAMLPKPRNEFEIVLPDLPEDQGGEEDEEEEEDEVDEGTSATVEDAADVEAQRQEQAKRRAEAEFRSRSLPLQHGLPRPTTINVAALEAARDAAAPEAALVLAEMLAMLRHDSAVFPPKGSTHAPSKGPAYERMSREELSEADALVAEEMRALAVDVDLKAYNNLHTAIAADFAFIPSQQQYARLSTTSKADRIASLQNELEISRNIMTQEATRAAKLEKQLGVKLGGYQKREQDLARQFAEAVKQLKQTRLELACFEELAQLERDGVVERLAKLQQEVSQQVAREADLQRRYADLLVDRRQLLGV